MDKVWGRCQVLGALSEGGAEGARGAWGLEQESLKFFLLCGFVNVGKYID